MKPHASTPPAIPSLHKDNFLQIDLSGFAGYPTFQRCIEICTRNAKRFPSPDLAAAFFEEAGQRTLRDIVYKEFQVEFIVFLGASDENLIECLIRNSNGGSWCLEYYSLDHRLSEKMHIMVL